MSVHPVVVHEDGSADVVFDEKGHEGLSPADQITFYIDPRTLEANPDMLILRCPDGCGGESSWPRETTDELVQQLFTFKDTRPA